MPMKPYMPATPSQSISAPPSRLAVAAPNPIIAAAEETLAGGVQTGWRVLCHVGHTGKHERREGEAHALIGQPEGSRDWWLQK